MTKAERARKNWTLLEANSLCIRELRQLVDNPSPHRLREARYALRVLDGQVAELAKLPKLRDQRATGDEG